MWIVAIAWMYVVILMAATESSVIGGIMTLVFFGVLPLSLLSYFFGAKGRRARHRAKVEKLLRKETRRDRR
jgi:membrane protein implicated in regulation of membrane protease activity